MYDQETSPRSPKEPKPCISYWLAGVVRTKNGPGDSPLQQFWVIPTTARLPELAGRHPISPSRQHLSDHRVHRSCHPKRHEQPWTSTPQIQSHFGDCPTSLVQSEGWAFVWFPSPGIAQVLLECCDFRRRVSRQRSEKNAEGGVRLLTR